MKAGDDVWFVGTSGDWAAVFDVSMFPDHASTPIRPQPWRARHAAGDCMLVECGWDNGSGAWYIPAANLSTAPPAGTAGTVEPVEKRWNTACPRCGAPAYQGFIEVECSKLCCPETTPRADQRQIEEAKSHIEAGLAALSKPRVWTKRVP